MRGRVPTQGTAEPGRSLPPGPRRSGSRFLRSLLVLATFTLTGCPWNAAGTTGCRMEGSPHPLPEGLRESSGAAWSLARPGVLWTHNDGDDPNLYALDEEGRLLATIPVLAPGQWDREDMATSRCDDGFCLYLADTGDNPEARPQVRLVRVRDTGSLKEAPRQGEVLPIRFPEGPRDVEAIFVLPGERIHLVSKGRNHGNTVYRYPLPLRPHQVVTLEEVQQLTDQAMSIPNQVTGADASPDGSRVVVRTYQELIFYQVVDGLLVPVEGGRVNLRTLEEPQGEGVAFGSEERVFLTSEGGQFGGRASLRVLTCR